MLMLASVVSVVQARIKLVALPERNATVIRLDNPNITLIEEERVLTLQKGLNKVDFSWKAVSIDADSIRLAVLDNPGKVRLLNVSYPPGEAALVWEIYSEGNFAETVRISYLLRNIDRLITYNAVADKEETQVALKSYVVMRNFSGEDFEMANVLLDYGQAFEKGIKHEETKKLLFLKKPSIPITKIWTFDSAKQIWDPEKLENQNVGIPVSYQFKNTKAGGLGEYALWGGKARIFQDDGSGSTIFLGEDVSGQVPVGEKMQLYIGDSRDIVVTQRQMQNDKDNIRWDSRKKKIILHDTLEVITAKIENFKDKPAKLTMIQHIQGQWKMNSCTLDKKNFKYERVNASTLKFEVKLPARTDDGPAVKNFKMDFSRINVRP
jgi:hypothetical protein